MTSEGKYAQVGQAGGSIDDVSDQESDSEEDPEAGRYVRAPLAYHSEYDEQNDDNEEDPHDDHSVPVDPIRENEMLRQQLADMRKKFAEITSRNKSSLERDTDINEAENSWTNLRMLPSSRTESSGQSIRWDQIKPFPKDVPATRMLEEWTRYRENFEIAASLSNAFDPVRRSQLLYLSMGDQMQGIVRAAKLRPNLNDSQCYAIFTKNIEEHLRSLTDTAAEHDAFTCMQQGKGETVMSFHSRLMEKAIACRYSTSNREQFVHAQLLKGMTNSELARTARTFGLKTNDIVMAATREEAYLVETTKRMITESESINHVQGRVSRPTIKRESRGESSGAQAKHLRLDKQHPNTSSRCTRCNKWMHRNRPCPALKLKCNKCGKFGHFAVVCRTIRVNTVQDYDLLQQIKTDTKEEEVKQT